MGIEQSGHPTAAAILAQVAADVAGGTEPTALLQRFLAPLVQICGAQAGAMKQRSADGRRFELVADLGLSPAVRDAERSVDAGCGACGAAAGTLEVALSDAASPCVRPSHPSFGAGCSRVLAVPLAHRGQVLGLCNLFLARDVVVPPQVTALLKTLGELLGLALHSARLEREVLRATVVAERQLMAAEVHDAIAQTLAYAKMRLPLLESAIAAGDRPAAQRYCADLRRAVGDAHGGLRDVLTHLRDAMPVPDLHHALQAGKQVLQECAAVDLAVDDRVGELHLSAPQEHQVQRIVQEALANIARHAGARHAWLTIERCGGEVEIRVDDDGSGFDAAPTAAAAGHFGLGIMRQRAAILGGAIEFARRQEGGTCVRLRFPVPGTAAAGVPA
jgi:two-component system nitrate/nitrite sensor histidine kinase NarX